ncbi:MAG TPA: DUF4153 domain-containing protein [Gemmatimonadales bacterium]|nr:DUF4153 domain-containing protein [Gemmatimonadales bacterium]
MRFPSLDLLARHALAVLRRFPWTLAAGGVAAVAAILGSLRGADDVWGRLAFVAALGLPLTLALALLGEARGWSARTRLLALLAGVLALVAFLVIWPGVDRRHDAIRYFQLSAALHLCVAFLPFLGTDEDLGFWQYNRRLFLGFLRALVFSGVLFVGIAIALGALDKLFGVDVEFETYLRIWFVVAFVVNTWIFLAVVPERLAELRHDTEYPRALKIFAQYILTPLAFTYLVILLAYLVKIVAGGEWPSGWIGWLVASVAVTGLLGFLLVHPLRSDAGEGWIRTYARWLFIGLIPAAVMLLVAFWKRILPYGLTEPRLLGLVLGLWLLAIAVLFTVRSGTGIRTIPVTLAAVLLLTLFGPLGVTRLSTGSQSRRLARMLQPPGPGGGNPREASAALRFLMDHDAGEEIAEAIGHELPPVDWKSAPRYGDQRDSLARSILALAGASYVPEYLYEPYGWYHLSTNQPVPVAGFAWSLPVTSGDGQMRLLGSDSVAVIPGDTRRGIARFRVGNDTLAFDLLPLARRYADSISNRGGMLDVPLMLEGAEGGRRSALMLAEVNGERKGDSLTVSHWRGSLLLGK